MEITKSLSTKTAKYNFFFIIVVHQPSRLSDLVQSIYLFHYIIISGQNNIWCNSYLLKHTKVTKISARLFWVIIRKKKITLHYYYWNLKEVKVSYFKSYLRSQILSSASPLFFEANVQAEVSESTFSFKLTTFKLTYYFFNNTFDVEGQEFWCQIAIPWNYIPDSCTSMFLKNKHKRNITSDTQHNSIIKDKKTKFIQ